MEQIEKWLPVRDFPNYEVSDLGNIRRTKTEKIKKKTINYRGYEYTMLYCLQHKKFYCKSISRLVWKTFNDCDCAEVVDHINDDKTDNRLMNLDCTTHSKNIKKRKNFTRGNKYELTDDVKRHIITEYRAGRLTSAKIYKLYNIPTNYFSSVIRRKTWDKLIND